MWRAARSLTALGSGDGATLDDAKVLLFDLP